MASSRRCLAPRPRSSAALLSALSLLIIGPPIPLLRSPEYAAAVVGAAPAEDLVDSLPGWDGGPLPSRWYSGFLEYRSPLPGGGTVHTHYVYVEAESDREGDEGVAGSAPPAEGRRAAGGGGGKEDEGDDGDGPPLIFWSNGGPGASSLFGLLTELGPLLLNDLSLETDSYRETGVPSLLRNPSSWNRLGSLLIFDAPAPVGFSYCGDAIDGDGYSCGGWDDESSAWNNYLALLAFYDKFPELRARPLYLTGESYAGVYVPSFARKILLHNQKLDGNLRLALAGTERYGRIPLKGFAVGDACSGMDVTCGGESPWYNLQFFRGHGQMSQRSYDRVVRICGMDALMVGGDALSPECRDALKAAMDGVGGYYVYGLYDDCTYRRGTMLRRWRRALGHAVGSAEVGSGGAVNDYACGGGLVMQTWLDLPAVRSALNVPADSNFFDGDNGVGFNYTMTEKSLMPFYYDVAKGRYTPRGEEGVKVLVYNGDTDPSINSLVAENWTSHLGLEEIAPWRPWTIDNCQRVGGYVTRYEGGFDFLTIRGAGHLVPLNKPEAALAFLAAWIDGEPYPAFDPTCPHP